MSFKIYLGSYIKLNLRRDGTWSRWKYCSSQSFGSEIALRHEISVFPDFRSELLALNGIGLLCKSSTGGAGRYV